PAPTNTPAPTPTVDPNAAADQGEAEAAALSAETLIAALPAQLPAGALTWRRTNAEPTYRDVAGGRIGTAGYNEPQGGQAEVTFGVFDTPEAALAFYEDVRGRVRTLQNATTRDDIPQPNAFGSGTYGSDAIWLRDTVYVRVSIPQFSSTAGNPLVPMSRAVNGIVDGVLRAGN
ncbi:MAG: hypothetical protein ACUVS2_11060, partial [Candidatus Flexifilum sp.]